jgi:hypothetical protein
MASLLLHPYGSRASIRCRVTICFFAYHGNAHLRQTVIDAMARHISNGRLVNGNAVGDDRLCLISAIAGGKYDAVAAHQNCGFPTSLLFVAEAIFEGLAPADAPHFALALMNAATIDTDLADVGWTFVEWMFAEAVTELGPSRVRTAARDAGPMFRKLAESGSLSPVEQQKAKAQAKRMRRRGREAPPASDRLVAQAMSAVLDAGFQNIAIAIHWIASLSEQPSDQYRRYARKLLELVETA